MLHEINLAGVLLPPLIPVVVLGLLIFWPVNGLISRYDGYRYVWHPALAGLCVLVMSLALALGLLMLIGRVRWLNPARTKAGPAAGARF